MAGERTRGMRVTVTEGGPYVVSGGVPLIRAEIVVNDAGESVAWREVERIPVDFRYSLCRCGRSKTKPFCDFSHLEGFDGAETADRAPYVEQSVCIDGPGMRLRDARRLCAEARFCDRAGGLWNLVERTDDPDTLALAREEAQLCPSGRYAACDPGTDEQVELEFEPSIVLVEDPQQDVSGPIWVRGGIPIIAADGTPYEIRNRVTLCRCGRSSNKPFCDGTHLAIGFRDESARG